MNTYIHTYRQTCRYADYNESHNNDRNDYVVNQRSGDIHSHKNHSRMNDKLHVAEAYHNSVHRRHLRSPRDRHRHV